VDNKNEKPDTADKGAHYEKLAFNFCKAATIVLLTGRYALTVASAAAAVLFFLAHLNGKKETRCILNKPIIAAGFWAVVCAASVYFLWLR
jgi:hypothetical protein